MKKLLALTFATGLLALLPQPASAWINLKMGVGANFHWQSGGNHFGWHGLWRNGQIPPPSHYPHFAPPVYYGHPAAIDEGQSAQAGPAGNLDSGVQATDTSLYHYSSYESGYYAPGYYYGQNTWYGW